MLFFLGIVISFIVLWGFLGDPFLHSILKKVADPEWWADNYLVFLIFGALIGLYSWWADLWEQKGHRRDYENWKIVIKNNNEEVHDGIYWQDVERFLNSNIECWRFIKSVVSSHGTVQVSTLAKAMDGKWITIDHANRTFYIDVDKGVACKHITRDKNSGVPSKPGSPL